MKVPGIYAIRCLKNGKEYIGMCSSRKGCYGRTMQHMRELSRGTHKNKMLQDDYKEFGQIEFASGLIEGHDQGEMTIRQFRYFLYKREIEIIDKRKSNVFGYNRTPGGQGNCGHNLLGPMKETNKKRTQEFRDKMREIAKNRPKINTPAWNKGIPSTDEAKEKMRLSKIGKLRDHHSEETKTKMSQARHEFNKTEQGQQVNSENASKRKEFWADEESRKAIVAKMNSEEAYAKRKETITKNGTDYSKNTRNCWADPKFIEKQRVAHANPETQRKRAESVKASWILRRSRNNVVPQ